MIYLLRERLDYFLRKKVSHKQTLRTVPTSWCCKQTTVLWWKIVDRDSKTDTPSIVCLPVHVLKIF